MNVNTLEAPVRPVRPSRPARASAPTPAISPARPGRRTGRGTGPEARPTRRLDAPPVIRSRDGAQSCSVTAPAPAAQPARWRLTDRGIALVLVTGLLITTAALVVVGLTALRVTGERYHHVGESALVQPVS